MKQFTWAFILFGSLMLPSLAAADENLSYNPNDKTLQTNECDLNNSSATTCFQHGTALIDGYPASATITTATGISSGVITSTTVPYTGDYYYYVNENPSSGGPGVMQGARSNPGIAGGALDVWNACRYVDNYGYKSYFVPFRTGGDVAPYEWTIFYTNTAPSPGVDGSPTFNDVDVGGGDDGYDNNTPSSTSSFKVTPIITHTCARPQSYTLDPTGGNSLCPAAPTQTGLYQINLPYARTGSVISYVYNDTCNPVCYTNPTTGDTQCGASWTQTTTSNYTALNSDTDNANNKYGNVNSWVPSTTYSGQPSSATPVCNPTTGGQDGQGNNGPYYGVCDAGGPTCGVQGSQTYYYVDVCGIQGPTQSQPCEMPACPPPPPPPSAGDGGGGDGYNGGGGDGYPDDDDDDDDDDDGDDDGDDGSGGSDDGDGDE